MAENTNQSDNTTLPSGPIKVAGLNKPRIELSPKYQKELNQVPALVKNANKWIADTDVTKMTENQITELRRRLRKVTHLDNSIKNGLKSYRRFWNNVRDKSENLFVQKMNAYHLQDLNALKQKATRINREILANRANRRWRELKPVFDKNIQMRPIIQKYAPQLVNFSRFRIMNPKLVSRAKGKPITDKHKKFINDTVDQWAKNIKLIADNPFHLGPQYQNKVLNSLIQDPNNNAGNTITYRMKDLKDQESRLAKQAKIRQQQALKHQKELKQRAAQPKKDQKKQQKQAFKVHPTNDPYAWLSDFIQSNVHLQQIKDPTKLKTDLIMLAANNSFKPNTFWSEHVKGDANYFVKLIKYIVSL